MLPPHLLQRISNIHMLREENKLHKSSVMITTGDNQAFVNLVLTLCDAGDSVAKFAPYYFNAYMSFQMTGVTNILVGPGEAKTLYPVAGTKKGRSLLIEDGALPRIVQNANNEASPFRRHIELALCHLTHHEVNVKDMITGGALWELVRISRECSREDIRTLAQRMLTTSLTYNSELRRLQIDY